MKFGSIFSKLVQGLYSVLSYLAKNLAVLIQAGAIAFGVWIAYQELIVKDRAADRQAREKSFEMLERLVEPPLRDEINELNRLTIFTFFQQIKTSQEIDELDFINNKSHNLRAYLGTFAGCIYSQLCDRQSGYRTFCPILSRYQRVRKNVFKIHIYKKRGDPIEMEKYLGAFFQHVPLSYEIENYLIKDCIEWEKSGWSSEWGEKSPK